MHISFLIGAPRYMLRDRDRVYGDAHLTLAANKEITEVLAVSQSPWQNPYVERLIGTIRRNCLDHVIVVDESLLRR
jgi:putative transposase